MRALVIALLAACGHGVDEPAPVCGNGIAEGDELCDDGNRIAGDGCSASCDTESMALVRWQFYPHVGQDLGPCPPEVANIEVLVDAGDVARFPCSAPYGMVGVSNRAQRLFARTLDANGDVLASTVPRMLPSDFRVTVAFYGDGGFVRVFIPPPGASCMSTLPLTLSLSSPTIGPPGIHKSFYCNDDQDARAGVLLSDPLKAGTYDVRLSGSEVLFTRTGVVVGTNNAVTDLDSTQP